MFYYLKVYKPEEPVNSNIFLKNRKIISKISNKFIDKLLLDEAMDNLPIKLKQVCVLYYKYDLPVNKIAVILNIHRNTVNNRLKQGIYFLDKFMQKGYNFTRME